MLKGDEMLLEKLSSHQYHEAIFDVLKDTDNQIYELIAKEYDRQQNTIQLLAAENSCSAAVLAALGSAVQNKTAEGFPGSRLHGGCEIVDEIESLAVTRAKQVFGAKYANVQPHSGTQANQIILAGLLEPGDRILSLPVEHGGHWSHGNQLSFIGKFFYIENYYVDSKTFLLDYDTIRGKAIKAKPKLIVCGCSAYAKTIDFKKFREIADEVGAFLLADISHISGLVAAGAHPCPVNCAHFTTTSTYKPGGPRGGLVLMGEGFDKKVKASGEEMPLWQCFEKSTFPGMQGTPYLNNVAAKAVFFNEMLTNEYKTRQFKIVENAKALAGKLSNLGAEVLTGGTDNHMVLINAANFRKGLTGIVAQKCLQQCGIIVDRILLPYDKKPSAITSGLRLGTPITTKRGMGAEQMNEVAVLLCSILSRAEIISDIKYEMDESFEEQMRRKVKDLCSRFPAG